jgi:hypothetical protein
MHGRIKDRVSHFLELTEEAEVAVAPAALQQWGVNARYGGRRVSRERDLRKRWRGEPGWRQQPLPF